MNPDTPRGVIELSDAKIKCIIFKIDSKNSLQILSATSTESEGIHNDVVVNLKKASNAVRLCISQAEKDAKVLLKKINVVFEQPEFLCTKFSKNKKINGSKIYKEDIEFLLKEAKKQLIHNDKTQSIIHIFNHNYIVDGKNFLEEPIGVYADLLTHEITFISTKENNLKNIKEVFLNCDIEIERFISRTFALGAQLLNNKELEFGSIILDLGFEKISLGLFRNLALIHSITFPIGINHLVKDISKVCSLNLSESTNIVNNFDFSFLKNQKIFDGNDYLKKNFFINSNFRKISKNLILNILKARLNEITDKLQKQIIIPGFHSISGINSILQRESNLLNIDKYFINFLTSDLKIANDNSTDDKNNLEFIFSSCFGAIKIIKDGWETEAIPETADNNVKKMSFFANFFKN